MRRSGTAIRTTHSWLEKATGITTPRAARTSARSWRGGAGLIILCLLLYIPGLWTIPPVDRDESRFAQASRQMLESGTLEGWVVPRVQDKPRLNKPPLIYWLQASSAALLGDRPRQWFWLDGGSENIWVYRVPSVLSAIAAVLLTWRLGLKMFDPRAAWLAAALLAVSPMVVWDAHQARADQLLLATTTATMLALWRIWSQFRSPSLREGLGVGDSRDAPAPRSLAWPLAFWLFLAMGIMTKGPITPMIAALTCLTLSLVSRNVRWLKTLRPILGALIVAAVVAPWVILVGNEVGWSKYLSIIYDETIGRSAGAKEGHWGPPGCHIVLLGLLFWPGSLLTGAAIGRAWRRGLHAPARIAPPPPPAGEVAESSTPEGVRDAPAQPGALRRLARHLHSLRPSRPAELFLLAWMLPSWIVFELISTKLPHYTMPLYPAVALITARALFGVRTMFLPALGSARRRQLTQVLANRDHRCPRCKYNLRGLTSAACPECSTPISITQSNRVTAGYATDRAQRAGRILWIIFGVALTVGMPLALVLEDVTPELNNAVIEWNPLMIGAGALCILTGFIAISSAVRRFRNDDLVGGTLRAMLLSVLPFAIVFGVLLPRTDSLWMSRRITLALHEHQWTPQIRIACLGYQEDSLVFLTRGSMQRPATGQWVLGEQHTAVVATDERMIEVAAGFDERQQRRPRSVNHWREIRGFNYSIGRRQTLQILEFPP